MHSEPLVQITDGALRGLAPAKRTVVQRPMHVAFLIESIPELPDGRGSLFDGIEPGGRGLLLDCSSGSREYCAVIG